MNKFCALSLGMLLCLAGCKDSEKKSLKERNFEADQKKSVDYAKKGPTRDLSFETDQKKLMDHAESWGLTNLETLGMTLDSTTKEYEEFSKKEKEYLKDFEGLPSKEYKEKREIFRNSKEYKEQGTLKEDKRKTFS